MKIILILLFLIVPLKAEALLIPTEPIGTAYNDGWWYQANSRYIGPANRGGTALGFRLSQSYNVSSFLLSFSGVQWYPGFQESVIVSLHKGSVNFRDTEFIIPSSRIIYESALIPLEFAHDRRTNVEPVVSVNLELESDDYWIAFRGGTATAGLQVESFDLEGDISENEKFAQTHAPEPATMLLMGGGLLAMLRRRNVR